MEIPRHWRLKQERYSLIGGFCLDCGCKTFPRRDRCPNCHGVSEITKSAGVIYEGNSLTSSLPKEVSTSSK